MRGVGGGENFPDLVSCAKMHNPTCMIIMLSQVDQEAIIIASLNLIGDRCTIHKGQTVKNIMKGGHLSDKGPGFNQTVGFTIRIKPNFWYWPLLLSIILIGIKNARERK